MSYRHIFSEYTSLSYHYYYQNHKVIGDGSSVGDGLADALKADLN